MQYTLIMDIIAIDGVKTHITLKVLMKILAPIIGGPFETLNFANPKHGFKTAYIRLCDKLDPNKTVNKICNQQSSMKLHAYIPDSIPELPPTKPRQIPAKLRRKLHIPQIMGKKQMISNAHTNIMKEMQHKFTGLFSLSLKTGHELLHDIGQKVYSRVADIFESNEMIDTCFNLTKFYRKTHPHFGDFQLILSTLHTLQDSEGVPREQIVESDLISSGLNSHLMDDLPSKMIQAAANRYTSKISNSVMEHINNLSTEVNPENDPIEEAARVKVRQHLKKLDLFMPSIISQVITKHFAPRRVESYVILIYGEPFLPKKEVMMPFVSRQKGFSCMRRENMYNLLSLRVHKNHYTQFLAADGTTLGGAKLVIRPANLPFYKSYMRLKKETGPNKMVVENMEEDTEWNEQW